MGLWTCLYGCSSRLELFWFRSSSVSVVITWPHLSKVDFLSTTKYQRCIFDKFFKSFFITNLLKSTHIFPSNLVTAVITRSHFPPKSLNCIFSKNLPTSTLLIPQQAELLSPGGSSRHARHFFHLRFFSQHQFFILTSVFSPHLRCHLLESQKRPFFIHLHPASCVVTVMSCRPVDLDTFTLF